MSTAFDPAARRLVVIGFVTGPTGTARVRFVLDTGANRTTISVSKLAEVGLDPRTATRRGRLRSATGWESAPVVVAHQLLALRQARASFPVVAHTLPPATPYDGLLGLDFVRGLVLTLDFARGRATLRTPRWWAFWRGY